MSLITRCPACETMFKVVPDQLRVSSGWVRCGHCSELFDASAHLIAGTEWPLPAAGAPVPHAPVELGSAVLSAPAHDEPQPASQRLATDPFVPMAPEALPGADAVGSAEPVGNAAAWWPPSDSRSGVDAAEPGTADQPALAPVATEAPALRTDEPQETQSPPAVAAAKLSFMRDAQRRAFWQRPLVRGLLGLAAMALSFLLLAQVIVQQGDHLAAAEPRLRPALVRICEPLGCSIQPVRMIESIAIDSYSFKKVNADTFNLGLSVKNTAPVEVAMPAIELTLTDSRDEVLVRRVLAVNELPAAPAALSARGDWSGNLNLNVAPGASSGRIVGYRVLAFYP